MIDFNLSVENRAWLASKFYKGAPERRDWSNFREKRLQITDSGEMWSDYGEEDVVNLIGRIYDAAVDPQAWPIVMAELRQLFEGAGVILFGTDHRTNSLTGVVQDNMPDDGLAEYDEHFVFIDPRVRFTKSFPDKKVAHDYLFTSDEDIRKSEYYDWLARHGFRYFLGTRLQVTNEITARFAVQFSPRQQERINAGSIKLLEILLPHIERALQVNQHINVVETTRDALTEVSESLSTGVILLTQHRDVFYMNKAAQDLLQRQDGLTLRGRRISARRPSENDKLNGCLSAAYRMHDDMLTAVDGLVEISRRSDGRPLTLIVVPMRSRALFTQTAERVVMILINDPTTSDNIPAKALKDAYSLTAAEARLATALVRGLSIKEYAMQARITENTARWQLKNIMSKTQTRRQTDLIKLILTGPARIHRTPHT
jgi:DNA-binding CsgD family transcriptional regulator/PAS domain-containing protein